MDFKDYYSFEREIAAIRLEPLFFKLPLKQQRKIMKRIRQAQRKYAHKLIDDAFQDAENKKLAKEWGASLDIEELMKGEVPVAIVPISSSGITPPPINWKAWREGRVIYGE